jgi:hypothetical protein
MVKDGRRCLFPLREYQVQQGRHQGRHIVGMNSILHTTATTPLPLSLIGGKYMYMILGSLSCIAGNSGPVLQTKSMIDLRIPVR